MTGRRAPVAHASNAFLQALASRITRPSPLVRHLTQKTGGLNRDDRRTLIAALANVGFTHYTQ